MTPIALVFALIFVVLFLVTAASMAPYRHSENPILDFFVAVIMASVVTLIALGFFAIIKDAQ